MAARGQWDAGLKSWVDPSSGTVYDPNLKGWVNSAGLLWRGGQIVRPQELSGDEASLLSSRARVASTAFPKLQKGITSVERPTSAAELVGAPKPTPAPAPTPTAPKMELLPAGTGDQLIQRQGQFTPTPALAQPGLPIQPNQPSFSSFARTIGAR